MKKIIGIFVGIVLCFSLVACSSGVKKEGISGTSADKKTDVSDTSVDKEVDGDGTSADKKKCSHTWQDATCEKAQTCSTCGETQGNALGHRYASATCTTPQKCSTCGGTQGNALGHQYSNGYCIRCNAKDPNYVELGTVSGTITYKYNNYVGNRGDTGAVVYLISKNVKSLPDSMGLGLTSGCPDNVYATKVSGTGSYTFSNVPAGEYYIVVISKNTNDNPSYVSGPATWGPAYGLFSAKGQENALRNAKLYKTRNSSVTVYGNRTTDYSYDFGITYI